MHRELLQDQLTTALAGRRLLAHPFYQRWSNGQVGLGELRDYAGQYRHFEAALPHLLTRIAASAPSDTTRDQVLRNLGDEVGGPVSHLDLFDRFCVELGTPGDAAPTAATSRLLATYESAVAAGPAEGMAAILAYEAQAPEVSVSKAAGLRDHYGLSDRAVEFWDVHGEVDREHAEWAVTTVAGMSDDPAAMGGAIRSAAEAWWAFLDERELAATAASHQPPS